MNPNRPHPAIVFTLLVLAASALVWLASCDGPSKAPDSTPDARIVTPAEIVRTQNRTIKQTIEPKLFRVGDLITGLTNENVNTTKPQLQELVGTKENGLGLIGDFRDLADNGGKLQVSVEKQTDHVRDVEKKNADLQAKLDARPDPVKGWFQLVGGILSAVGAAILVIGFLPLPWTVWAAPLRGYAIVAMVVGFTLLTLARFLSAIEFIIAGTLGAGFVAGIVVLVVYLVRHMKKTQQAKNEAITAKAVAADVVKSIDVGVAAGQIVFTDDARDPKKSIVKAYQSDLTAAFVDSIQQKPKPAAPVNGFANVAAMPPAAPPAVV